MVDRRGRSELGGERLSIHNEVMGASLGRFVLVVGGGPGLKMNEGLRLSLHKQTNVVPGMHVAGCGQHLGGGCRMGVGGSGLERQK